MDIISKRWFYIAKTLADRISIVKIKKAAVKIPKLRVKTKKLIKAKKEDNFPVSSIVNILIKAAVEKAKTGKKKIQAEENKKYALSGDDGEKFNGGYGTASKSYGASPNNSYVDYEKLFSYLGKFKSQSAYENMAGHLESINKSLESGSFTLADKETMEKGTSFLKYFAGGHELNPLASVNPLSLVPVAGMSGSEWEQFKMWMRLDPVMYLLKTKIS